MARSNMGAGSLALSVDDYGLAYKFDAPNTQCGNDAIEMINRGDLFGSSFAFWTDEKKMLPTSGKMASYSVQFTK